MARVDLAYQMVSLVGPAVAIMRDPGTGWPSKVDIRSGNNLVPVSLHVAVASPHSRQPWEWRFQNPGARPPVQAENGELPILVGLDDIDGQPVLIATDGESRVGRVARFSILYNKRISQEAARVGWSEQVNTNGDRIFALRPHLFPLLVDILRAGVEIPAGTIAQAAAIAGAIDDPDDAANERIRRQINAYVRDQKFGRNVRMAYENKCAMCRIGLDLIVGAHILPVQAPGAPDQVWNGIGLCHNHHSAFDKHNLWIGADYGIQISPSLREAARGDEESTQFLAQTRDELWVPAAPGSRPRVEMLKRRYEYYDEEYQWAPDFD